MYIVLSYISRPYGFWLRMSLLMDVSDLYEAC